MKYWRGYLVAAIIAALSWGLTRFAETYTVLVDMIYPYVTRLVQNFLASWSSSVAFCVWQVILVVAVILLIASIVLMILFRWNPIQWFGWVLTGVSVVFLLNTAMYGLNDYAGPLADDIRLEDAEYAYTVSELKDAAVYYRDIANELSEQVTRDSNGDARFADFSTLAEQAGDGFDVLTYQEYLSVFAGSTVPVKELGWSGIFTSRGITGLTVPLTGEAAVNPEIPAVCLPFAMCHEMAHRMTISIDSDASMAAFMACAYNPSVEFRYSAYFMAYRYCYNTLASISSSVAQSAVAELESGEGGSLRHDLDTYNSFFGKHAASDTDSQVSDLLVVWHIEKIVLPQQVEETVPFDPRDPSHVDLTGIANAKTGS